MAKRCAAYQLCQVGSSSVEQAYVSAMQISSLMRRSNNHMKGGVQHETRRRIATGIPPIARYLFMMFSLIAPVILIQTLMGLQISIQKESTSTGMLYDQDQSRNQRKSQDAPGIPPPPEPLPEKIMLLRVPKASSSSMSAFLRQQYPGCISPEFPPGDCTRQNQKICPQITGCTNHHNKRHLNSTLPMVTAVRNPIQRYLSAYNYPGHHGQGTGGNVTLHIQLFPEWNNTQVNFFAGQQIGTWGSSNAPRDKAPDYNLSAAEQQERLQDALYYIRKTKAHVGLVEYLNDSLRLFCRRYHCCCLEESLRAKKERVAKRRVDRYPYDSPETMEILKQANANDIVLYEAARHKFCYDLVVYRADSDFWETITQETKSMCANYTQIERS